MSLAPLLDTHAWIWWLHGDARLGRQTIEKLDELPHSTRPAISGISLWEAATLVSLGRLELKSTFDSWLAVAAHSSTVRVLPITAQIASEVARLPDTFQRDPADRLIVSTSRVHGLAVLTRDAAIAKSGLVRLWSPGGGAQVPWREALPRVYELKSMVPDPSHPDAFFQDFEGSLKRDSAKLERFRKLEKWLRALDGEAWAALKRKAAPHLMSRTRHQGRGWQSLFDVLNEAIGFAYLKGIGCTAVHFIESATRRTPDLGGVLEAVPVLCEVKTINISKVEAEKRVAPRPLVADKVSIGVSEGFIGKLRVTVKSAVEQLDAHDPQRKARRMIFIVVHFDDWVGDYQQEYFREIDEHLLQDPIAGAELVFYPWTNAFELNITMKSAAVFLG